MTVTELMDELAEAPGSVPVLVDGREPEVVWQMDGGRIAAVLIERGDDE